MELNEETTITRTAHSGMQAAIYVFLMESRKHLQIPSAVLSVWPKKGLSTWHVTMHCYIC